MTVPFESIGPGQSMRLAYQVIGEDGPIFNPQRIRYIAPDSSEVGELVPSASGFDSLTALAGVNLAVGLGNLALAAATYRSVQQLHAKVDSLLVSVSEMKAQLDALSSRVQRIDIRVAESHLRESMKHVFRRAWSGSEIDLRELAKLKGDFEGIFEAIEQPLLFNMSVRLSSDVRDHVHLLASLLRGVRGVVCQRHNLAVGGDPNRVLSMDPLEDYVTGVGADARSARAFIGVARAISSFNEALCAAVHSRFTFSDADDIEHFERIVESELVEPVARAEGMVQTGYLHANLPDEALSELDEQDVASTITSLMRSWLWNTDAGLLVRATQELRMIDAGYVNALSDRAVEWAPYEISGFTIAASLEEGLDAVPTPGGVTVKKGFWSK